MALTVYYVSPDATGAGDGSGPDPADAYTWTAFLAAANTDYGNSTDGVHVHVHNGSVDQGYSATTVQTLTVAVVATKPFILEGYNDNPGDGGRADFAFTSAGRLVIAANNAEIRNLDCTATDVTAPVVDVTGTNSRLYRVSATHSGTTGGGGIRMNGGIMMACYGSTSHDGSGYNGQPLEMITHGTVDACIAIMTGLSGTACINMGGVGSLCLVSNSSCYGVNALNQSGVAFTGSANVIQMVSDCSMYNVATDVVVVNEASMNIVTNLVTYSANSTRIGITSVPATDVGNWHISNYATHSATRHNLGEDMKEIDGVGLTADPFIDSVLGDFRLNTVAGGGAACRSLLPRGGWPGTGISPTNNLGAVGLAANQAGFPISRIQ